MRLPLISPLATRDGLAPKDERLTNTLRDEDKVVVRPALTLVDTFSGTGNGLVAFQDELLSVYGATLISGTETRTVVDTESSLAFVGSDAPGGPWYGIRKVFAEADGKIYGIVSSTEIQVSTDGLYWDPYTLPAGYPYSNVGAAPGIVVVGSTAVDYAVSTDDGVNWTAYTLPTANSRLTSIVFSGTEFVAIGQVGFVDTIWTSPDGVTWTDRGAPTASPDWWQGIGSNPTLGLVWAMTRGSTQKFAWSTDHGVSWTVVSLPAGTVAWSGRKWEGYTYNEHEDCFYVAGHPGEILQINRSTEAITVLATNSFSALPLTGCAYLMYNPATRQYFAVAGAADRVAFSVNGTEWTEFDPFPSTGDDFTRAAALLAGRQMYWAFAVPPYLVGVMEPPGRINVTLSGSFFDFAESTL